MKFITLTLSPALDLEYQTSRVNPAGLNRAQSFALSAGGKGVNVSRAIRKASADSGIPAEVVTLVPLGGDTGALFRTLLERENLPVTVIPIEGNTRVNVSLIPTEQGGGSLEINAPGTPVGTALAAVEEALFSRLEAGDAVVLAGSVPSDVPKAYPAQLCRKIREKGAFCAADADGEALSAFVKEGFPDLIKPNADELERLTGRSLESLDDVMDAAESLRGVGTVLTTLAADGAILSHPAESDDGESSSTFCPAEERPVIRLKGAGDTFLGAYLFARFAAGMSEQDAVLEAVRTAGEYVANE